MKANDSLFIVVVVQQWCVKLGRARLAHLICNMSLALNRDSKKRSVPNFQKSFDSIEVDEKYVFKLNSKIMKALFFFVVGKIWMLFLKMLLNSESTVKTMQDHLEVKLPRFILKKVKDMLNDRNERAKVRKHVSLLHQYANQLFPFNGDSSSFTTCE